MNATGNVIDRFILLLDVTKACVHAGDFISVRAMLDELNIEAEELSQQYSEEGSSESGLSGECLRGAKSGEACEEGS
jgi:hypothetical protein